jgi:type IV secretory pathway TraG/TraD family ATPase VirD4
VLATSTRKDLVELTAGPRSERGPVYVFNPEGDGDLRSTLRWSPVAGCEHPRVALERARALMRGAGVLSGVEDSRFWTGNQARLLPAMLNAAAVADKTLADVHDWIRDPGDDTPLRILERHPMAQHTWAQDIAQVLAGPDRTRDNIYQTLVLTFSFMADPAVRHAVTPSPGEMAFDPHTFLAEQGSLYLLGADVGPSEAGSIAPLFTALTSAVWDAARGSAASSIGGRLDPPLLLALDEVANICPVPLPQWTAQAGGSGITVMAVVQSPSQLVSRWGTADARTIWNSSTTKAVLGGISLPEDLEDVSRLIGETQIERTTTTHGMQQNQVGLGGAYPTTSYSVGTERVRTLPPERLRTLPEWHMVLISRRVRPVLARYTPVWDRADVRAWRTAHPGVVLPAQSAPTVPAGVEPAGPAPAPPAPDVWERPRLEVVRDLDEQQRRDAG